MARQIILKASFQRAYHRLSPAERDRVKKALRLLQDYLDTGYAPIGLGLKKLGSGVYEFRVGLALRGVYVEEGSLLALVLLGSHDEVRRFLKRS
jgi:mRNA-degrading endonuclease RelE of RelBE toxin-antitoxin system